MNTTNSKDSLNKFTAEAHATYGMDRSNWPTKVREQYTVLLRNAFADLD